ncbi:MAG: hypothetical protein QMD32_06960 [Smithellaceae bacterium]|nr:hypothetical protein [Smithellaceae bacterium]
MNNEGAFNKSLFRHSELDQESSVFKYFWIPAPVPDHDPGFAGMTPWEVFTASSIIIDG